MAVLSLVIATFGRDDQLHRCLSSIAADQGSDFEVIVVDQNVDDRVEKVIRQFSGSLRLLHLRQAVPGASAARNLGALHATGDWIGFPDDDCCFLPDTLDTLRRLIRQSDADLFTGLTVDEVGRSSVLRWPTEELPINKRFIRSTCAESTLYVRREVFWSVGGFDPLFGPGSPFAADEGADLIRRLWRSSRQGIRMRFYPTLRFYHADARRNWDEARLRKARDYAIARGACTARHWRYVSKRRILIAVAQHLVGSLVLRGNHRRSRYVMLFGYFEGFFKYHAWKRRGSHTIDAAELHLTRG